MLGFSTCIWLELTSCNTRVQIYVEVERARLTRMLAALKEEEGDTTAASDILQEARVAGLPAQLPPQCTN